MPPGTRREAAEARDRIHAAYGGFLGDHGVPLTLLSGSVEERLAVVSAAARYSESLADYRASNDEPVVANA
jgi:hypothetical protein